MLIQLYHLHGEDILSKDNIVQLNNYYRNKEVVISFYGTSNGGKSTLLNSILGAKWVFYEVNVIMTTSTLCIENCIAL